MERETSAFAPSPSRGLDSARPERSGWVFGLAALAAVRVLVHAAAFPVFGNVDEAGHFDLVLRYSRLDIPHELGPFSDEAALDLALYGTPEYLHRPAELPGGLPRPPWTRPFPEVREHLRAQVDAWKGRLNHEASGVPLYYGVAGVWLRLGEALGQSGGLRPYWVRFFNAPLAALLVLLSSLAARLAFPRERELHFGTALMAAALPQDAFYSISNDVLSPIFFGAAFVGLLALMQGSVDMIGASTPLSPSAVEGRTLTALGTGAALSSAVLSKVSNLPLLVPALLVTLYLAHGVAKSAGRWAAARVTLGLALASLLPLAGWAAYSHRAFGDFTGSSVKIAALGWTPKPMREWLPHPILTPSGAWFFASQLLSTLFRGELVWGLTPLAVPAIDLLYVLTSALFVTWSSGVAVRSLAKREKGIAPWALLLALLCIGSLVASLLFLSVSYDFGACPYPSRASPFFISGRLLLGALVPFLLLFVHGLHRALAAVGRPKLLLPSLGALAAAATLSEAWVNRVAFHSPYNWFHLFGG
jgi:hypothetical protein